MTKEFIDIGTEVICNFLELFSHWEQSIAILKKYRDAKDLKN